MVFTLARASLDGAILVAAVWVLSRLLRLTPATRTVLWWCAAGKFVVALAWTTPIAIPVLPAQTAVVHRVDRPAAPRVETQSRAPRAATPVRPDLGGPLVRALREWSSFATIGWSLGLLLAAIVAVRRWRATAHMLEASEPAPVEVQADAIDLASRLRLRRVPDVRISDRIETPLVTGLVRPVVLLPAGRVEALTGRQRQMALCHELAHLKRADLWLGCVPALAERVFFFHPLVHLASREYALSREAACDAAVMKTLDAAPQEYGRLLLSLGVSQPRTGFTAAGGAWSFLSLKRRIAMLQDVSARLNRSRVIAFGAIGLAVAAMVPMQLAARPGTAQAAAATAAEPRAPLDEERRREPAASEQAAQIESRPNPRGLSFVMMLEDDQQTTSGPPEDVARARQHRRNGEPLLWFRYDGREYVIRDPEVLRQAGKLWADVYESGPARDELRALTESLKSEEFQKLGELRAWTESLKSEEFQKLGELRAWTESLKSEEFQKLGELRAWTESLKSEEFQKLAELGALTKSLKSEDLQKYAEMAAAAQEWLGTSLGSLSEHAKLGAHLAEQARRALADAHEVPLDEVERHTHSLAEAGKEIEEEMRELEHRLKGDIDAQMHELRQHLRTIERPIREMAAPMEEFGRRMEGFGKVMERSSRVAAEEMRALIERALASGLAQPVR